MTPFSIVHDVGIGDFINCESLWSPERKASLELVYHASINSPGSLALIDAMVRCPALRHARHRELLYPTQAIPGAIPTLRDHAIGHRLPFFGSAFLAGPLDCQVPDGLPGEFIYIQHSTPKNGPNCRRFITGPEWPHVIARLEAQDAVGLVVNSLGGKSVVPDHPRLIDFTGKTSFPQAIEVLKRARGYIGIDSCLAILAAQLFGPADLRIRTQNPYLYLTPWFTYPPLEDFSFLCPRFDGPRHPEPAPIWPPGTIVELRCNALIAGRNFGSGARVEIDNARAALMLASGQAIDPGGIDE